MTNAAECAAPLHPGTGMEAAVEAAKAAYESGGTTVQVPALRRALTAAIPHLTAQTGTGMEDAVEAGARVYLPLTFERMHSGGRAAIVNDDSGTVYLVPADLLRRTVPGGSDLAGGEWKTTKEERDGAREWIASACERVAALAERAVVAEDRAKALEEALRGLVKWYGIRDGIHGSDKLLPPEKQDKKLAAARRLLTAQPATGGGEGWRPISEAPCDDTRALVWWENGCATVEDLDHDSSPQWWAERGATHWQPEPAPPTRPAEQGDA